MRQARIKPLEVDAFMHLYNRVAGHVGDFPFGPAEKEHFTGLMRKLLRLYTSARLYLSLLSFLL